ncbi:MAG: hypothetical protein QME12_07990, partial [Nanoarchaeota archaeon]|nr:hypothetical protein [Nanoarchaeota archaeon]
MEKTQLQHLIESIVTNGRGYDTKMLSNEKMYPNARTDEDRLQAALYYLEKDMPVYGQPKQRLYRRCHQLMTDLK